MEIGAGFGGRAAGRGECDSGGGACRQETPRGRGGLTDEVPTEPSG